MSNRHKHADMIIAKAENMDLVVFLKPCESVGWFEKEYGAPQWQEDSEYFLCLPKHKDAVLSILNGGESEVFDCGEFYPCTCGNPVEWRRDAWYMGKDYESRIKPKKEKRYIGVYNGGFVTEKHFKTLSDVIDFVCSNRKHAARECVKIVEIEVEV